MKNIVFLLFFCCTSLMVQSQNESVENSTFGIQVGFLGVWAHNEVKLTQTLALRTEIGFDSGIWGGKYYDETGFVMTPVLTAEPRWYYNLKKRFAKSKNISNNSGNFVSLKSSYHPDWFVISNSENVEIVSDISIIPTLGIRRNIGNHFNYEAGIGVGYRYIFSKQAGFLENDSELALNVHLRVGYRF